MDSGISNNIKLDLIEKEKVTAIEYYQDEFLNTICEISIFTTNFFGLGNTYGPFPNESTCPSTNTRRVKYAIPLNISFLEFLQNFYYGNSDNDLSLRQIPENTGSLKRL